MILDGPTMRRMIATGLGSAATPKPASPIAPAPSFCALFMLSSAVQDRCTDQLSALAAFDSILDDYLPPSKRSNVSSSSASSAVPPPPSAGSANPFDSLLSL